ncbi:unnamed protein product [Strongylus vulgaris]|uniref:Uncharacterized protein n=1 Tax=Strongylus vulgaris TaxID=40348 RepID=A0A3P7JZK9_STRVU|nr:unnamed protein product [Strongylus vulgaris]
MTRSALFKRDIIEEFSISVVVGTSGKRLVFSVVVSKAVFSVVVSKASVDASRVFVVASFIEVVLLDSVGFDVLVSVSDGCGVSVTFVVEAEVPVVGSEDSGAPVVSVGSRRAVKRYV